MQNNVIAIWLSNLLICFVCFFFFLKFLLSPLCFHSTSPRYSILLYSFTCQLLSKHTFHFLFVTISFLKWPYLLEGKICRPSTSYFIYSLLPLCLYFLSITKTVWRRNNVFSVRCVSQNMIVCFVGVWAVLQQMSYSKQRSIPVLTKEQSSLCLPSFMCLVEI